MEEICDSIHNFPGYWKATIPMALTGPELRKQIGAILKAVHPYLRGPKRESSGLDVLLAEVSKMTVQIMGFDSIETQFQKVGRNNAVSQLKEKIQKAINSIEGCQS
jgi:hypothetical protein